MITVEALKFDRRVRKSWKADLVEESDDAIVLIGTFDEDVPHSGLGLVKKGTVSKEYFFTDRWFNIFEFREPTGEFRNYYCNIAMPAEFDGRTLRYVDLDIDVVMNAAGEVEVADRDDFSINSERFGYPQDVKDRVERTIVELLGMIERREWPFTMAGS